MCLIITAFAAVIATLVWYFKAHDSRIKLGALALMYWSAALMWIVDGFFAVAAGEAFLDLSADDALLGLVIVLCGLTAWVVMLLAGDPKRVFRSFQLKD
jgi:hypothetical protein